MDSFVFVYKCRRCEKLVRNTFVGKDFVEDGIIDIINIGHTRASGSVQMIVDCHICDDGGYGITDLQGAEPAKK